MDNQDKDRLNAKLRESEDRYRSVTETLIDAIITTDAKDSILTWNNGAESTFSRVRVAYEKVSQGKTALH
jgi:PAS domain-containing protein